jgi:hypothetical protein
MGRRARSDEFRVEGVVERLAPYDVALVDDLGCPEAAGDELVERAATLLQLMPANQRRETIEDLVSPNDQQRGRDAVDALIESAFAAEDVTGRLRRVCAQAARTTTVRPVTPRADVPPERPVEPPAPRSDEPASSWHRASRVARLVLGR